MKRLDLKKRHVALSVGAFAQFGATGAHNGRRTGAGLWRMQVGQAWHALEHSAFTAEGETNPEAAQGERETEHTIAGKWERGGWIFELSGRIDQVEVDPDKGVTLREIKTVRAPLPALNDELARRYPHYWKQLASYLLLHSVRSIAATDEPADPDGRPLRLNGELVFIDIDTGIRQVEKLSLEAGKRLFEAQLDGWLRFLRSQERSAQRRKTFQIGAAFPSYRTGQVELLRDLAAANVDRAPILLEAPTGFGKTGIILEYALHHLQDDRFDRIIYLTSKSTGQLETIRQLRTMSRNGLHVMQMRNYNEHARNCFCGGSSDGRNCREAVAGDAVNPVDEVEIDPEKLFAEGFFPLERAVETGQKHRLCPYQLSVTALAHAEVWVADFNYIFAPGSQGIFASVPGFSPERSLLIIDEAHNLPDRTASALSLDLTAFHLGNALDTVKKTGATSKNQASFRALLAWLDAQAASDRIAAADLYELASLLEDAAASVTSTPFDWDTMPNETAEVLWGLKTWAVRLNTIMEQITTEQWLCWAPDAGHIRLTCLDPASYIAATIGHFGRTVLMSATLHPVAAFAESCGLSNQVFHSIKGAADWRENAYRLAIDARVDTRYTTRAKYYETTARTIALTAFFNRRPPVAVFFPSFQYAENVREYLMVVDPGLRIAMQSRKATLAEQEEFIDESLLLADVLFLILGSGYAEGIDKLGGRIDHVIVVSPALAEVNAVQAARMATTDEDRAEAFNRVYLQPGMRKIQQALGRVVRGPGQSAAVILHCKRFADPACQALLDPVFQQAEIVRNTPALEQWLQRTSAEL